MTVSTATEMLALWELGVAGEPTRVRPRGTESAPPARFGPSLAQQGLRWVEAFPGYDAHKRALRTRHVHHRRLGAAAAARLDAWIHEMDRDLAASPAVFEPPHEAVAGEEEALAVVAAVEELCSRRR